MRIQHNIMAMSAYRNYNNNTSALSKNLEKLSSGYKINRAGDDAAGLAISEKMRAQITGLSAAQKNVKDGISLVKTAEGAMQEIHDMLNRMDYLATQSANGTYDNEVDRAALQKEVNQLNSEIDRIAESANFNGIKLLDGTWDTGAADKAKEAIAAAQDKIDNPEFESVYQDASLDEIKGLMLKLDGDGPNSAADVGNKTVLETDTVEFQKPSFQVSLDGVSHVLKDVTNTANKIKLNVGGTDIEITDKDIKDAFTDKENGDTVTSEELAEVFAKKAGQFEADDDADDYKWTVRADGKNLVFEFDMVNNTALPDEAKNKHFDTSIDGSAITGTVAAVASIYTTGAVTASTATGNGTIKIDYTDADGNAQTKTVTYAGVGTDADGEAAAIVAAINGDDDLKVLFAAAGDGGGITLTSKVAGAAVGVTGITFDEGGATGANVVAGKVTTEGKDAVESGTTGYVNAGTEVVIPGVPANSDQLASTSLDFSETDITDGMQIRLGDETYTFAVGADSAYKGADNVVDLTAYEADKLKVGGDTTGARAAAFSKLSEAAKGNETFTVSHQGTAENIGLKQKSSAKGTTDMTTMDSFAGYIGVSSVDEAATKANRDAAVAAAKDELAKAQEAADNAASAKALQLQIGDTSDSYNQLGVGIGSMRTTALGVDGLSIANAEDAAAAIQTIKDAINYVSSVRGDLGAYQNRLEHTGNNLSVMAENIQDAESTIRDTDVAEEMMGYVKNNILVQSAQAMLAQANQVPQGVLQLLG